MVNNSFEDAFGSSDLAPSDNTGYLTSSYPNVAEGNKSAGIELSINTIGYSNIVLKFNIKCAANAANKYIVQYAIDGVSFIDFQSIYVAPNHSAVFLIDNVMDFSAVSGINNNPNVKFRIVSSFGDNENNYVAVNDFTNGYNSTGSVTFDMVSVTALGVLPFTLSSFVGAYTNKMALLKWTTENEININKYVVERSIDAKNFTEIGSVAASARIEYYFTDANIKAPANFYRLKIVGTNESKYSAVVKILSDAFGETLNLYPSPAVNFINAEFVSESKTMATMQMLAVTGEVVMQKVALVQQGYNNLGFNINSLNKGIYVIKITVGSNTLCSSFFKQ